MECGRNNTQSTDLRDVFHFYSIKQIDGEGIFIYYKYEK